MSDLPAPPAQAQPLAPPVAAPLKPVTYDQALIAIRGPWRGIVAIVLLVVGYFIASTVFGLIAIVIDVSTGEMTQEDLLSGTIGFTPAVMFFNNLSLAALIPISMLLQRWLFGVRFRTLWSVAGRIRWVWMARLAIVIVPAWLLYIGLSFVLEPAGEVRLDASVIALIVIVLLTTPLQAAGEEVGARGLIQRSAGSWFANPTLSFVVSTILSGALFCLAHAAGDPWLIAYYFTFGASMSLVARFSGGLEAPMLIHATNNVLIFVPAVLFGQLDEGIDRSEGAGGPFMLFPMAMCLAAAGFTAWWARRQGVETTAPPAITVAMEKVLAAPKFVPPVPITEPGI